MVALQRLAGNRATGQLLARLRAAPLPEHAGLDVAPLLAAQVPELLPLIDTGEIAAMQTRYDAQASNKVRDKRIDEGMREYHKTNDDFGDDDQRAQVAAIERRAGPYKAEEGPLSFSVPTEKVLSEDILAEPPKNKAIENAFRKWVHDGLMKDPVVVVKIDLVARGGAAVEMDRRAHPDAEPAYWENKAALISGGRSLPHTRGKVHLKELVEQTFPKEYDEQVTHNPAVVKLRTEVIEAEGQLELMYLEHKERIEKNKDHPVVRRIAEFLGGGNEIEAMLELMKEVDEHPERGNWEERQEELSSDCPDIEIWDTPRAEAKQAYELLGEDFELGAIAVMRAEAALDKAARRFQKYEARVMKGAGIAVKWLGRAKFAGKIAASALPGSAVVNAAVYSLVQEGGQQVAEVAEGERKDVDFGGLAKQAGMEGAMALFAGLTQGAFAETLALRMETKFGAEIMERYGVKAMDLASNKFIVTVQSAALSAPYNLAASKVLEKIVYGKTQLPKSVDELADMVLDEVTTSIGVAGVMHGVHGAFEEPGGRTASKEHEEVRPGHGEHVERVEEPHVTPGAEGATPGAAPRAPSKTKPTVVELAEHARADPKAADAVIDHFGSWEQTMEHAVDASGDMAPVSSGQRRALVQDLLARRQGIVDNVGAKFGGKTDPTAAGGPGAGVEITMDGNDAGLKVAQANVFLDAAHPGWQSRYKIGVGVGEARAKSISEAMASLPKEMQGELTRHQQGVEEAIRAGRAARRASPAERTAIVQNVRENMRDLTNALADFTDADAAQLRVEWMTEADRAFQRLDAKAAPADRLALIKKAMNQQMLADAAEAMPPKAAEAGAPGANAADGPAPAGAHEDVADKAVSLLPKETVMSPGRATSLTDARTMYKNTFAEDPGREAALYRNTVTGEYIIVQGERSVAQVAPGEAPRRGGQDQRWKEILDKGSDVGRWELQAHSHPTEASGAVHPANRYPSGAKGDMGAMVAEARAAGHARSSRIDYRLESGPSHTDFGFDPANDRPYWIDVEGLPGMPRRFATMESYHEFLETQVGVDPGEIPPSMSGKTPAKEITEQPPGSLGQEILELFAEKQEQWGQKQLEGDEGEGAPMSWPEDPMAYTEFQSAVRSSRAVFAELPGERGGKTVALAEGGEPTESGRVDTPGYAGKAETVGQARAESLEAGHTGAQHFFDERGLPGSYGDTHAERQAAQRYPNRPIGVSKPMCADCVRDFTRLAQSRQVPQVVTDPLGTHLFMPDGRHIFVREFRPTTQSMRSRNRPPRR